MKIVIPMAGMGTRMRPHTLTVPKPLISVAGKPIVQRLVEDIASVCNEKIEEVAFIIGNFGKEVEDTLIKIAESIGAKGSIHYQLQALGTAHAVYCAEPVLDGNVIVAFADTLFFADFKLDKDQDGIIWVHRVEDPSAFGVVKTDSDNVITDFIEKPKNFVSDLAIIGIYYFKDGKRLKSELKYLIDNNINVKGEFQLTDALENMKKSGLKFSVGAVREWLDCGNKNATVLTNNRILHNLGSDISKDITLTNSVIINPCFIAPGVTLVNSVVGPYASIGTGTSVTDSIVKDSIVQEQSFIQNANIANSMLGSHVRVECKSSDLSLSDYSTFC